MFKSAWLWISGIVIGSLALLRALFVRKVRVEKEFASRLYDLIRTSGRCVVVEEEISVTARLPRVFSAYCWLRGVLFRFSVVERMLRAGWQGTDSIAEITVPRWQFKRLLMYVENVETKREHVAINIMGDYGSYRIGKRKIPDVLSTPFADDTLYDDLSSEVEDMVGGKIIRTSALLYGPPGNGKSFLARYLALKYSLDIHLMVLTPDISNQDLVRMFGHVKGPAMILIEDFDAYFDGRVCKIDRAKFSLDAIPRDRNLES
jgi:hypothetical protein